MALKQEQHTIKGMNKDLSISKFNPELAFDARNIRITARENHTLFTVTNEKGNKEISVGLDVEGKYVGHCVINKYLILFTTSIIDEHNSSDCIYRLLYDDNGGFTTTLLFKGTLNLKEECPLETLGIYENENIQKVYWIDDVNSPRVINITNTYSTSGDTSGEFDFSQEIKLLDTVSVKRNTAYGEFPSGVVQYAFTYFNKYAQETNVFNQSDLLYTSIGSRAGSPEEVTPTSFKIDLTGLDTNFDYVRIYSIFRTSINATPTVKIVADLQLSGSTLSYIDTNTTGSTIDPTILLYIGAEDIIVGSMTQKDNTLFFGNIKLKRELLPDTLANIIKKQEVTPAYKTLSLTKLDPNGYYNHQSQLEFSSNKITTFKAGETYRFGVQFQYKTGKWSEVLYMNDFKMNLAPEMKAIWGAGNKTYMQLLLQKGVYDFNVSVTRLAGALGYVRMRGVVVYPTSADRDIICQGIICPTVYNTADRNSNSPYAQSSWFARPFKRSAGINNSTTDAAIYGSYATFFHNQQLWWNDRGIEIQNSLNNPFPESADRDFFVDQNIVTFHSPDIEFGDAQTNIDNADLKFRITGYIEMGALLSEKSISTSTPNPKPTDLGEYGNTPSDEYNVGLISSNSGGRLLISGINWISKGKTGKTSSSAYNWGWLISPWMRSGSVINSNSIDGSIVEAKLLHNRLSNLRIAPFTTYGKSSSGVLTPLWNPPTGISSIGVWNSNEQSVIKISRETGNDFYYYGNIDKVQLYSSGLLNNSKGYTLYGVFPVDESKSVDELYKGSIQTLNAAGLNLPDDYKYFNEPVPIKYKSTPHAVFSFNINGTKPTIAPDNGRNPYTVENVSQDIISAASNVDGLWVGELYREVLPSLKFGGNTPEALEVNRWVVAGPPVRIVSDDGSYPLASGSLEFLEGDTYLQRYDCLKTYPYTLEDLNSVTEIVSFCCETRVNIDGRYDRNRGLKNNLSILNTNFNLMNPVYSQRNNFFTYNYINKNKYNPDNFPNTITWSKEKTMGELTDTWTNITLASTLDLDGDKGEIVSLNTYNNEIFCFQKTGFSNILFNARVQIPTSDGVPIEITNGMKVGGKRYISNIIGCSNKWSIAETPSGLFFIDNIGNSINKYNGQMDSISDRLGFRQWIGVNNSHQTWNPKTFDNFIAYYDRNNNDVYFIGKGECLCYSELLNQFTSFMSYEETPAMFNINSDFFAFKNGKIWKQFAGDYNMFFGEFKPYSVTIVANDNEPYDKIFNTIEFRASTFNDNVDIASTFDTLEVWNEYQYGKSTLTSILGKPSALKRKFRVWRANIPRDQGNNRDRIRNTWAYIKLGMNVPNTYRTEFHDAIIHYFI